MNMKFRINCDYFEKNKTQFQKKYSNKVLLIVNAEIKGIYDSVREAYEDAIKQYQEGEFICQIVDYDKQENIAYIN